MGFMENLAVAQAGQANKLAKKQLREQQRIAAAAQQAVVAPPQAATTAPSALHNQLMLNEVRQLNAGLAAMTEELRRIADALVRDRPQD